MNNKAHLRPKDYDSNGDIIPMACKEEKGDLISREALKKALYDFLSENSTTCDWEDIFNVIDNAPTVPLPDFKEGYKQAIIDGKTNFSRPQGEWGKHGECPFCSYIRQWEDDKFCGNCGAYMQKGGAE